MIIGSLAIYCSVYCSAQRDSNRMVQYTSDFHFRDGVYANFNEWKNNSPRISDYDVVKTNTLGAQDEVELWYSCKDSASSQKSCIVKNCFGYVDNGAFYISQGYEGYYFRVFIIGGLTHFLAFTSYEDQKVYYFSDPSSLIGSANDFSEYVLDFNSGESFIFTYKNFTAFLKERDPELYQQLITSKNKHKMIHHFMIKYNERHPIYIPVE
jgi:hypothetical protein